MPQAKSGRGDSELGTHEAPRPGSHVHGGEQRSSVKTGEGLPSVRH